MKRSLERLSKVVLDYRGIARADGGVSYFSDIKGGRRVFVYAPVFSNLCDVHIDDGSRILVSHFDFSQRCMPSEDCLTADGAISHGLPRKELRGLISLLENNKNDATVDKTVIEQEIARETSLISCIGATSISPLARL